MAFIGEYQMNEELFEIAMGLIVTAGSARSYAMEGMQLAKEGKFEEAHAAIEEAEQALIEAHHVQTSLLSRAANGESIEISIYMVHAQDHLMTSILAKDMAKEIIELHQLRAGA